MNILIDNILDIQRIESGRFPVEMSTFTLQPLLEALCNQYSAMARMRDIELKLSTQYPDIAVHADRRILRRVLANLLSNAVRHTVKGCVSISAVQQEDHIILRVADTGEGIDAADLDHVFSPYYQGGATRISGAVGLGLTFCQRAVEAHYGEISVQSNGHQGSVFSIKLPHRQPATAE